MDNVLGGQIALITGGASGIGRATALAMARAGASVVVADLDEARAEAVAQEIIGQAGRALAVRMDAALESDIAQAIQTAVEYFGGLDILHNNAALSAPEAMSLDTDIVSMDAALWDEVFAVNLRGPMLGCKYAIPHMLTRGGGAIINTSSASGLTGDIARPAYGVSKGGLNTLTQYVATLYGKRGIRCNAIAPGVIETPALAANIAPEVIDVYERNHLTPRLGQAEDIAAAAVFLASPAAAFITGQIISVDGGLLAHHPAISEILRTAGTEP